MALTPELRDRLICPICGGSLSYSRESKYICPNEHTWPEIDQKPVLRLAGNADLMPTKIDQMKRELAARRCDLGLLSSVRRLISTNYEPYRMPPEHFIKPGDMVCNAGSGMQANLTENTLNIDYFAFQCTDVIADLNSIPVCDDTFDVVVCEFVLEHVLNPFKVCRELMRIVSPGGLLYLSYPFIHPFHSFPSDYFRFTHAGIRSMLPEMHVVMETPLSGPASRWIGATADLLHTVIAGGAQYESRFLITSNRSRAPIPV
jgi:SAM-dependent methyltransferase